MADRLFGMEIPIALGKIRASGTGVIETARILDQPFPDIFIVIVSIHLGNDDGCCEDINLALFCRFPRND
jgi:hypothetical protein